MNTRLQLLQAMPVFGGISERALQFLLESATTTEVSGGERFFREGELGESMFVLESGRVAVVRELDGEALTLAELDSGDCFGEMALIECMARSATVQALEDCRAFELAFAALHELYRFDNDQFLLIQMNLARELSRRLRKAGDLLSKAREQIRELRQHHELLI